MPCHHALHPSLQASINGIPDAEVPEAAASLDLPPGTPKAQVVAALQAQPVLADLDAQLQAAQASVDKCQRVIAALSAAGEAQLPAQHPASVTPPPDPNHGVSAFNDNGFNQQADELLAKLRAGQVPPELAGRFLAIYRSQLPALQQYLANYAAELQAMQVSAAAAGRFVFWCQLVVHGAMTVASTQLSSAYNSCPPHA